MNHKQGGLVEVGTFSSGKQWQVFPGGMVDWNPSANVGDTDSIPGPGKFHIPWSN